MTDTAQVYPNYLCQQMERLHSTLMAVTVALEYGAGCYEPMEFTPALKKLVDDSYILLKQMSWDSSE